MPQHPELPFDILEGVIDTLAADDTPTFTHLKSFSLTCKSLLHSCRKHIFKTIIVGLPVPMDDINEDDADDNRSSSDAKRTEIPPERLCWLISVQPQLSEYVRVLKLGIAREHDQSLDIAQVLRCFRRLQSLTLDTEHDFGPEYMTKWSRIPHELQQSVLFLIERETLTALTLRSHCKFPLFQAKLSVNLHCLHIENLTIFEEGDGAVSLSHHVEPIFLRRYSIGYSGAGATTAILGARLADGRHIFDFSELRHLRAEICYFPEAALDLAAAHDVIRRTTQLRTLSLKSEVARLEHPVHQRIDVSLRSQHEPHAPRHIVRRPRRRVPQYAQADYNTPQLPARVAYHSAVWALRRVRGDMRFPQRARRGVSHGAALLRRPLSPRTGTEKARRYPGLTCMAVSQDSLHQVHHGP